MKIFFLVESSHNFLYEHSITFLLNTFAEVTSLQSRQQFVSNDLHNGAFLEKNVKWHGAFFSLCSRSHNSSIECRDRSKMCVFEENIENSIYDHDNLNRFINFCKESSFDASNHKETFQAKDRCVPFLRFCDMMRSYVSKYVLPDADPQKACFVFGKSPKSQLEIDHYFGDLYSNGSKWNSSSSYRNLCSTLSNGIKNFYWIDTNASPGQADPLLDNLLATCKGTCIFLEDICSPILPLTALLHASMVTAVNSRGKVLTERQLRSQRKKAHDVDKECVRVKIHHHIPEITMRPMSMDEGRPNKRSVPLTLDFDKSAPNTFIPLNELEVDQLWWLEPLGSVHAVERLSKHLTDAKRVLIFKASEERSFVIRPVHISGGRLFVLQELSTKSNATDEESRFQSIHPVSRMRATYPLSVIEPWFSEAGQLCLHEDMVKVVQSRLERLQGALSAVRHHDMSRLLQSPCRPCPAQPSRLCSPDAHVYTPRDPDDLQQHVAGIYAQAVLADRGQANLARAARNIVATIHRYSRFRSSKKSTADNTKNWCLSFISQHLKKDSESMKDEHAENFEAGNLDSLLQEFQIQLLIAFESNALEMERLEPEPNSQLVDWAADIMQTFVMLSKKRESWREFLHVHLVDRYHKVMGRTLFHLFTELGQDPPECLPEDCVGESDVSFIGGLGSSFQADRHDLDDERELAATVSTTSSPHRRDSLSRPELGDQNSQSSAVIHLSPVKRKSSVPKQKRTPGRQKRRRPSGPTKSPSKKKRAVERRSPQKTPTKGARSKLVVKGTPSSRSNRPRWERACLKAAAKSRGRIVVQESPQKPAGRELRRLRSNTGVSQGLERGLAWKVALEDYETSLSQFVEINGFDNDDDMSDGAAPECSEETTSSGDLKLRRRHSNLFANLNEASLGDSTFPFSLPPTTSSPRKPLCDLRPSSSPTKSILRTPGKDGSGLILQSPVKSFDRRRVLMSPNVRRRTFSGNEPAAAYLDEGTMFLDDEEFAELSATGDHDTPSSFGPHSSDIWESPRRKSKSTEVFESSRVCRRLFMTPEKKSGEASPDKSRIHGLSFNPRRRLVFSKQTSPTS